MKPASHSAARSSRSALNADANCDDAHSMSSSAAQCFCPSRGACEDTRSPTSAISSSCTTHLVTTGSGRNGSELPCAAPAPASCEDADDGARMRLPPPAPVSAVSAISAATASPPAPPISSSASTSSGSGSAGAACAAWPGSGGARSSVTPIAARSAAPSPMASLLVSSASGVVAANMRVSAPHSTVHAGGDSRAPHSSTSLFRHMTPMRARPSISWSTHLCTRPSTSGSRNSRRG
mmetsp:Transcript_16340/g.51927  ORF Transcript_16340/g.51927 Transcript_16340/m.51927 type:complete len:236 (-) Transcript_16340:140-847(-)